MMTNNPNGSQTEFNINGQWLEEVKNFKYLGAIIPNKGSKPAILSRIAQTTASKVKLMRTFILSTFFYAFESLPWQQKSREGSKPLRWDAIGDFWAFPTKTMWRTRRFATESIMQLDAWWSLTMVKRRKLRWYGHISRSSGLAKTMLQGTVKGTRRRRRQKKRWEENIKEWSLENPWGQRKTGKDGKVVLQHHL